MILIGFAASAVVGFLAGGAYTAWLVRRELFAAAQERGRLS